MPSERNVEKNLGLLAKKWGMPRIDTWMSEYGLIVRLWFGGWHQHHGIGMHGGFVIDGSSLPNAIMRAWLMGAKNPPFHSQHCQKGCPHYVDDCY